MNQHYYTQRERERERQREREREFCGIAFNLFNDIYANDRWGVWFEPPAPTTFLSDHDQFLLLLFKSRVGLNIQCIHILYSCAIHVNIGVTEACSYTLYTKTLNTCIFICNIYKTLSLSLSLSVRLIYDFSNLLIRPNESFIRPNESFICPNESFICSNDSFIRPNESFIRPNESFIRPNDLLIRPNEEIFFFIWPLYAAVVDSVLWRNVV